MTFAFTDTLWFNAVEAEVYAPSILFTVLTLLLALKWMEHKEDSSSLKYFLATGKYISDRACGWCSLTQCTRFPNDTDACVLL